MAKNQRMFQIQTDTAGPAATEDLWQRLADPFSVGKTSIKMQRCINAYLTYGTLWVRGSARREGVCQFICSDHLVSESGDEGKKSLKIQEFSFFHQFVTAALVTSLKLMDISNKNEYFSRPAAQGG